MFGSVDTSKVAVAERALGPNHLMTLNFVQGLAKTYGREGRYADAEPLFRRVAEAYQRTLGPENPNTLGALNDLASNEVALSRYSSERMVEAYLALYDASRG